MGTSHLVCTVCFPSVPLYGFSRTASAIGLLSWPMASYCLPQGFPVGFDFVSFLTLICEPLGERQSHLHPPAEGLRGKQ